MSVQEIAEPAPAEAWADAEHVAAGGSWASLRRVAANASWLTLNQALSYILPLVTTPILTRGFGPDVYGVYSTGLAYGAYVALLVTYGFNYYGPRAVALSRADRQAVQRIYAAVLTVQAALALGGLAMCSAILVLAHLARLVVLIDVVLVAQAAVTAATPLWLFVGLERLRAVALAQVAARLALFAATIALVRRPADLLPLATAMLAITAATLVYTLHKARRTIGRPFPLRRAAVREVLAEGAPFFWSSVAVSAYASSAIVIVGAVLGPGAAGYFALADKLRVAAVSLTQPLSQAVYPLFNTMAQAGARRAGDLTLRRLFVAAMLAAGGASSLAMFCFAGEIIRLLGGHAFGPTVLLLRIMAPVPLVIGVSNILGRQTLIPWGHVRLFTAITFVTAAFGVVAIVGFLYALGLTGAAWSVLVVESFVAVALAVGAWRKGLLRHAFGIV